jgi:hypothetical protein
VTTRRFGGRPSTCERGRPRDVTNRAARLPPAQATLASRRKTSFSSAAR